MKKLLKKFNNENFWFWIFFLAFFFPIIFFVRAAFRDINEAGVVVSGNYQWFFTLFDDAMIGMTYARTFVNTGELVWFPGAERVQGFTNLLWTLYMSLLHIILPKGSQVSAWVSITGIFCVIGSSFLSAFLIAKVLKNKKNYFIWSCITAIIIFLLYPLVFWSLRGMEVGALSFLLLLTLICSLGYEKNIINKNNTSSFLFNSTIISSVIGILIRIDFAVLVFVMAVMLQLFSENKKKFLFLTFAHISSIFITIALVLILQYFYYNDFLPNTYRSKVEGYSFVERIINGFIVARNIFSIALLVAISILISIQNKKKLINKIIIITGSVFFTAVLYSIWVGGDAWEGSRMANRYVSVSLPFAIISIILTTYNLCHQSFNIKQKYYFRLKFFFILLCFSYTQIFYPFPGRVIELSIFETLAVCFVIVLLVITILFCSYKIYMQLIRRKKNSNLKLLVTIMVLTLTSGWPTAEWLYRGGMHVNDDYNMSLVSKNIKMITTNEAVIAVTIAGASAYYSERKMIDILGKSDREIASRKPIGKIYPGHNKWDYEYSIGKLKPDVVLMLWAHTAQDINSLINWGYKEKCFNGKSYGYFLEKSSNINWFLLDNC